MCEDTGHSKLWAWFGLSYASFLTLPRALMHKMSDEWQGKMADLLEEYDNTFEKFDFNSTVRATKDGRLCKMPKWLCEYRYPNKEEIEKIRIK